MSGPATTMALPPIPSIASLPASAHTEILDVLFEPSPALHTLSLPLFRCPPNASSSSSSPSFDSYPALISAVEEQLRTLEKSQLASDIVWLDVILQAHPRLGEKKKAGLSELSRREQEAMEKASRRQKENDNEKEMAEGTTAAAEAEGDGSIDVEEELRRLNVKYETAFGGLKYVTFVNSRPRAVILADMRERIARGNLLQEKSDAIKAMCEIARDRAGKLGVGVAEVT